MPRILSLIFTMFRELIFDSREEYDFRSKKFNVKKVLLFVILTTLLAYCYFATKRAWILSAENVKLNEKYSEHIKSTIPIAKNPELVPSDSGNTSRKN